MTIASSHSPSRYDAPVRSSRAPGDDRPRVSVVSVTFDAAPAELRRVSEHCARLERFGVELILVCAGAHAAILMPPGGRNGARFVAAPADATEPQLRRIGFGAATGDVVLMADDPLAVDDAWIAQVSGMGRAAAGVAEPIEAGDHPTGGGA